LFRTDGGARLGQTGMGRSLNIELEPRLCFDPGPDLRDAPLPERSRDAPPPRGPIFRPGHHAPPVRMERHGENGVGVAEGRPELSAGLDIPEARCPVMAAGQQRLAVGAERDRAHLAGVSAHIVQKSSPGQVPEADDAPLATGNVGYCNNTGTNPPCIGGLNGQVMLAARSRHPGGVSVGMCDGSVKFIKNSVNPLTYMALSSTQGNEVISADAY
jgi:prepilin-type processing-associated H-X9-DG protein